MPETIEDTQLYTKTRFTDIMSVEIDNNWYARDFTQLFESVHNLYDIHLSYYIVFQPPDPGMYPFVALNENSREYHRRRLLFILNSSQDLNHPHSFGFHHSPVGVSKLKFGSKGFVDFFGIGEIFKSIQEIIFKYIPNKSETLNNKLKELEIEKKQLELLEKRKAFYESLGLSQLEILSLIGKEITYVNSIIKMIDQKLILDIKLREKMELPNEQK